MSSLAAGRFGAPDVSRLSDRLSDRGNVRKRMCTMGRVGEKAVGSIRGS